MDLWHSLMQGFGTAATPVNLFWAFLGCLIGTAIGVLPGIGPALTVAMLLPLTAHVDPTASMILFGDDTWGGRTLYAPSNSNPTGNTRQTWGQNFCDPCPGTLTAADDLRTNPGGKFPKGRHLGGVVMTFADGHSKWVKPEVLYNNGNDSPYYKGW